MKSRPLLTYFVLVFILTWGVAGAALIAPHLIERVFGSMNQTSPLFFLAVYAPAMASLVLTTWFEGRPGLKRLFARLNPLRTHWVWYLVVVGGFIAVSYCSGVVGTLFGGPTPTLVFRGFLPSLAAALFLDPGPLGEELGWRGFALPRMLDRWSPTKSSLILGFIWGVWHLPAFYFSTLSQSQLSFPVFVLGATGIATVMTWLMLRSRGSLLIAILAHLMANHAGDVTRVAFLAWSLGIMVAALLLIATGQLRKVEPAATHSAG